MDFIDKWREEINTTLIESAQLAANIKEVDLEFALMATGVLWPLRHPVQEFDMEAIETVNKLVGRQAKHILRTVQRWDDDMMAAARGLNLQLVENPELDVCLNVIIKQFRAFFIFTEALSKQPKPYNLTAADAPPPVPQESLAETVKSASKATSSTTGKAAKPPRVFVSYARSDGEKLAQSIRQRLEQEGISVWQDRVQMEGGRDWWLQIVAALNQVEFMVLILTPAAMRSKIVRKEWRYARQQGVCVYPVKGSADLHFTDLPRWMRNVHFYDPQLEWTRLVKDVSSPCQNPRVPFMVEELPDDFILRSGQAQQLKSLLLDQNDNPIITTIALHGMGGYGKTTLAKILCHDEDIRQAFDDGILWVTLGENPGDLTGYVVDLIEILSGERPGFTGLDAAETRLLQLLTKRNILLVLDDVWNIAHLKPFMRGGMRVARLITARNIAVLPPKTQNIEVAEMERDESIKLLSMGLPQGPMQPFHDLAQRLGQWPMLLKLTNGVLRDRVFNNNQPLQNALRYINRALDKRGLTAFDAHNAAARNQAVSQTLGVSQDLLATDERQRYSELAIFPGDVNIPLTVLEKLWAATAALNSSDTEELCDRFYKLSLLAHFNPTKQYITLHNIIRNYLAQKQQQYLPELHNQLLQAYAGHLPAHQSGRIDWAALPNNEYYLWSYLAYHLIGAERDLELVETVKDLLYLVNKTHLRGAYSTEADLLTARQVAPADKVMVRLHQAISQSNHLLNQAKSKGEIANTLHSRIVHVSLLTDMITDSENDLPKPLFTVHHHLPDLPDASLIRTLPGHGTAVLACDISADGSTIVSMGRDTTLKLWDTNTGAERSTLIGHQVIGNSCALSADGTVVVSATWDGVLKIWDSGTGKERLSFKAHTGSIFGCAISDDGATVVTAAKDKTVKVWDAHSGQERFTLTGHERSVTGCAISADGSTIISVSPDGKVKIWDAKTGQLRISMEAYGIEAYNRAANLTFTSAASALLDCDISAAGTVAVSVLPDGVLKVWDVPTGTERLILKGHTGWVENCALSADGNLVVSVSNDKTVRGWDAKSGVEKFLMEGHLRAIAGCAVSADGKIIASASQDKTLKLWDAESGAEQSARSSYISAAQICAISNDGKTIIFDSPGNMLKVLAAETLSERFNLKGHMRPVTGCAISADGQTIITSSQDRTLKIWDVQQGTERATLRGHMWAVNDCALSPDGTTVVSVSEDSTIKVWDMQTGTERFKLGGHMRAINGCIISPDNTFLVSASADKTLKVWDMHTGTERLTLTGHTKPVNDCAISPDNKLIASVSNDKTLIIWDSQTGQIMQTLTEHSSSVLRCAFHPHNDYLLSVSKDMTLRLWDIESGQCITTLRVDGPLAGCAWFPDGQHIVAVGSRGVYFLQVIP